MAFALTVLAVFAFILGFNFLGQVPAPWLYITGFLLFGLSFGGCITIYPTIVGEYFGKNNQAKNYSVIYQGFAAGALITLIFNILISQGLLTFGVSLLIGAVFLAIAAVLLFVVKKPGPPPLADEPATAA